ncbi:hypothetical protein BV898_09290 [Hypsibius exemplaris]|uniref:Uncharacterized protein n=1 Tax=Hypsibius exemplaris TaxID=2072580 RepID=A0A1W0WN29_HYPEX|nr:hypothetical protein BV898_09290 [Hypsibius exemplaris]
MLGTSLRGCVTEFGGTTSYDALRGCVTEFGGSTSYDALRGCVTEFGGSTSYDALRGSVTEFDDSTSYRRTTDGVETERVRKIRKRMPFTTQAATATTTTEGFRDR